MPIQRTIKLSAEDSYMLGFSRSASMHGTPAEVSEMVNTEINELAEKLKVSDEARNIYAFGIGNLMGLGVAMHRAQLLDIKRELRPEFEALELEKAAATLRSIGATDLAELIDTILEGDEDEEDTDV